MFSGEVNNNGKYNMIRSFKRWSRFLITFVGEYRARSRYWRRRPHRLIFTKCGQTRMRTQHRWRNWRCFWRRHFYFSRSWFFFQKFCSPYALACINFFHALITWRNFGTPSGWKISLEKLDQAYDYFCTSPIFIVSDRCHRQCSK